MRPAVLVLLAACLGPAGCATSPTALPVCDGKHRRPANPHGSVLDPATPSATPPTIAAPPGAAATPGCGR